MAADDPHPSQRNGLRSGPAIDPKSASIHTRFGLDRIFTSH